MSNRFFLDPVISAIDGDHVVLGGDEAHHFCRVMRGEVGDEIILFDGSGLCYRSKVESVDKTTVTARIVETLPDTIESPLRLTVATALPKGDRQRFLTEKLAELGVARLIPLRLERSVARADAAVAQRLRRYVVEAAKQCGRNVLMEITNEITLHELNHFLNSQNDVTKFLLHPLALGEVGQTTPQTILAKELPKQLAVLVGPEGSFTDQEIETALSFGFQPLHLGARILRTETACIAAAAVFLAGLGK
ncbi:MAG: 16S rRNA (uracil(1498)-N(3))-methyltransferase [Planctomycetaceae bacterium]|jgi:16S rRNA (uracil1498-N3)-methyltransferase|nr:16S rRNA (uracil(1498)-N(3))-methyltransferase [Planctomycetaceae bacterium]